MWDRVNSLMKNRFELGVMKRCLKVKKIWWWKTNINFYDNEMPKEGYHCVSVLVILIDSVRKIEKTIIRKYFWKCVNMFEKKIRWVSSLIQN